MKLLKTFVLVALFALGGVTHAAVAFDANSADCNMTATPTVTHTAAGTDRYVIIAIYANDDTTISAISYGAQTPTLIQRFNLGFGSSNTLWIFGLVNPNTGSQTVSATLAGGSVLWAIGVSSYTGVDQTTPIGSPVTAEFSGASPVTVDATSSSGELVVDMTMAGGSAGAVGGGQTQRLNTNFSGNLGFRIFGMSDKAGAATTNMSWTITSPTSRAGIIAVPLKAAAGGGGGTGIILKRRAHS